MAQDTFGPLVDVWGALVMGKGDLAPILKTETEQAVALRALPNLKVSYDTVSKDGASPGAQFKPALIFEQDLGQGGIAHMCLHAERKGANDLEIEWWLAVKNVERERQAQRAVGAGCLTTGVLFVIALFFGGLTGNLTIVKDAGRLGGVLTGVPVSRQAEASQPTEENITQSLALAHTIDYCLMHVLGNHDIDASQLRVTHPSKFLKIGHLANS